MSLGDELIPEPILDQATAWIVRLHDAPGDTGLRAEFEAWVSENDVNARAWSVTQRAWHQMGQVPTAFAGEWPPRRADTGTGARLKPAMVTSRPATGVKSPARRLPLRRVSIRTLALGLAACVLLGIALPTIQLRLTADYRTAVAESRQIPLEDGSVVDLAPDSAVGIAFSTDRREVILLRGEAYFEVATDRARPFSVHAEDLDVTVTGTAFDVGFTERSFSVAVARGSVRVARAGLAEKGMVDLGPGQGLLIDRETGAAIDTAAPPATVAAWRAGRLIVENALLTDVVAVIGRYHTGTILITDARLREKRVTGGFDLRDPGGALRVLVAPYGGVVREFTSYLLVLSAD